MKQKVFFLTGPERLKATIDHLNEIILDGSAKVTIGDAGTKTTKQRGLQWMWMEDIHKQCMGTDRGQFDTKIDTHIWCKWKFGLEIAMGKISYLSDLYKIVLEKYGNRPEVIKEFIDDNVKTETFEVGEMAKYLTEIQTFFTSRGVFLREPEFRGLLDCEEKEKQWLENQKRHI